MNRKHTLPAAVATLVVLATVLAAPAAAAPWDSTPDDITQITHGSDATPSWHVEVQDGELGTLASWANGSEDRRVLRSHNDSNYALVQATPADIGDGWRTILNGGLQSKSYVADVNPNYRLSNANPVDPEIQSDAPSPGTLTSLSANAYEDGAEYSPKGVAFADDANESRFAAVRNVTGQDRANGTGVNQTIAVVDTEVNTADGRVFGNGSSTSEPRVLPASKNIITNQTAADEGYDAVGGSNGHGTWVAAAAAANASGTENDGMAPDADILAVKALDEDGQGSSADIAEGIRYSAEQGADVIILSLGSPLADDAINDAIDYAVEEHNVSAVTVAAGNDRQGTRWVASPASQPNDRAIAVAATNTTDNRNASVAYFSNLGYHPGTTDTSNLATQGQEIDVAAPGMNVTARVPTESGTVTNRTLSGTSMANPFVGGGIAAVLEERPDLRGNQTAVREEVRVSARPMQHAAAAEAGQGLFAGDNLNESVDPFDQRRQMTDTAYARDKFWRGLSDASGGVFRYVLTAAVPEVAG